MPLKRWILQSMNRMNGVAGRSDLPRRTGRGGVAPHDRSGDEREPSLRAAPEHDAAARLREHLGAYAPLISAIREELEHFVTTQLRLHLAIAERDRYLLTSIDVECVDGGDGADLVRRFKQEFTPEQIKRFLARDVIAHLPNASAIDLSQFGGLDAARAQNDASADAHPYAELVAQLRATTPSEDPRAFEVTLLGRWTEIEPGSSASKRAGDLATDALRTPLAGSRLEIAIEDADGSRHVALASAVPNRRYSIGKGEGADIAVNGTFASRRHCEIWLDSGRWWVADSGSRNGIRVESALSVLGRSGGQANAAAAKAAIELVPGARIVLSAVAQGEPRDYPRVSLQLESRIDAPATPLAPPAKAPTTPVTPIAAPLARRRDMTLTVTMASGVKTIAIGEQSLPMRVGRSRNQHLIVDRAHEGVSGHHVDIASVDDGGAEVEVHGDNGVTVGEVTHPPGSRFRWVVGERMTLGRASGDEPECALVLSVR